MKEKINKFRNRDSSNLISLAQAIPTRIYLFQNKLISQIGISFSHTNPHNLVLEHVEWNCIGNISGTNMYRN